MNQLGVEVGNLAPEFALQDASGNWISLSDFRGKKVFLFSWATWCRCKEQLPDIEKFHQRHKSEKFVVLTVASDSQGFKWVQPYLGGAGATFVTLVDPANELAKKYNFLATENGFLIDEYGVIRMSAIGFDIRRDEQREELERLIKTDFDPVEATKRKSIDDRIGDLEAGLEKHPKATSKRLELAEFYRQKGELGKAESELRTVIKHEKKSAEAHYRLGINLYQQGKIEEAVKEWEKAYKYEPTNYLYMRNIEAYYEPEKFYSELIAP
ncbi:MAG: redoxin domain-containing protein [bacterium]